MITPPAIVILGAGNVGTNLLRRMIACGITPVQLYNRTADRARTLGDSLSIPFTSHYDDIVGDADLYMLAVKDDAIAACAMSLSQVIHPGALVVHSSGATPSTVLKDAFSRYGVFYPLQTFTRGRTPDFSEIPICIDAAVEADLALLSSLANQLGCRAQHINDEERALLHVAAVVVNNFVNHLYHIGFELLREKGIGFELLLPLIRETAFRQISELDPAAWQTGPAKRNDRSTIEKHLALLSTNSALQSLYKALTADIIQTHYNDENSRKH
jgi:predicted short-subunit dehydrogenase-like oxidoreductase (DUF2520 family)